jgi:hypothetical protein
MSALCDQQCHLCRTRWPGGILPVGQICPGCWTPYPIHAEGDHDER